MPELSISTWSLHRALGKAWYDRTPDGFVNRNGDEGAYSYSMFPEKWPRTASSSWKSAIFIFPQQMMYLSQTCVQNWTDMAYRFTAS